MLIPCGGQPFIVIVVSDATANKAWSAYESQPTSDSFDARRANVVVISDSGLGVRQRERACLPRWHRSPTAGQRWWSLAASSPQSVLPF